MPTFVLDPSHTGRNTTPPTPTNQLAIYCLSCRGSVTSVTQTAKGECLPSN